MLFSLDTIDPKTSARAGTITTDHGTIQTPVFMPVGTGGTVKAIHYRDLYEDCKAEIILGQSYQVRITSG
jgi:queuine tRNA-ribosyltransferase